MLISNELTTFASYPPTTPEKQKAVGEFFGGIGAPPNSIKKVPGIVENIKKYNPNLQSFGIVGVCIILLLPNRTISKLISYIAMLGW